jgi:hypothetical protein
MPRVTDNLRDAQALAEFSNLETAQVEYFRHNYPDFVPDAWWDYEAGGFEEKQWQLTQGILRYSWKHQFKDTEGVYSLIALVTSVFNPNNLLTEELRSQKLPEGYTVKSTAQSFTVTTPDNRSIVFPPRPAFKDFYGTGIGGGTGSIPFHRAAVYLFEHKWRARFCMVCNKRFVAAEPKNKFCGESCSHENSIRRKREAWHLHKGEWRPTRKDRQRQATRDTKRRANKH